MFNKMNVDIIYRLICLIVFSVVVLFVNSPITLGLLVLFFFLTTKNNNDFTFIILYIISFFFFAISYMSNNYSLMKLGIIIDYVFYFLNVPNVKELLTNGVDKIIDKYVNKKDAIEDNLEVEESEDDLHYMRFSNNKEKERKKNDLVTVFYITVHFAVLFLSIMVG